MTDAERRVRIDLAYDGSDFHGWQLQPAARTVQGVVEGALGVIHGGDAIRVRGASRTDSGVHARGQVADAVVRTRLDDDALLGALASLLPPDVRPRAVRTVAYDFHARNDAVAKTYRYWLDRTPHGDPLVSRFALHAPRIEDPRALLAALPALLGRKDWAGFAGSAGTVSSTVRSVMDARFDAAGTVLAVFTFTADGFLNHMVRNLVGTLLEIARGRFLPRRIDEILASGDRTLAGPTAPAHALCLERVFYPEEAVSGDAPPPGPAPGSPRAL